jgi:predicted O-methyltransferase YrrM
VPWHLIWLTPKDCSLANLEPAESYDIIFIDAQKSGYPTYLKMILDKSQPGQPNRLLRPGGLIIGDNFGPVQQAHAHSWADRGHAAAGF